MPQIENGMAPRATRKATLFRCSKSRNRVILSTRKAQTRRLRSAPTSRSPRLPETQEPNRIQSLPVGLCLMGPTRGQSRSRRSRQSLLRTVAKDPRRRARVGRRLSQHKARHLIQALMRATHTRLLPSQSFLVRSWPKSLERHTLQAGSISCIGCCSSSFHRCCYFTVFQGEADWFTRHSHNAQPSGMYWLPGCIGFPSVHRLCSDAYRSPAPLIARIYSERECLAARHSRRRR